VPIRKEKLFQNYFLDNFREQLYEPLLQLNQAIFSLVVIDNLESDAPRLV
jgi:hypothetical protein